MNTKEALIATLTIFLWLALVLVYVWIVVEITAFSAIIGAIFFFVSLFLISFILFRFVFPK